MQSIPLYKKIVSWIFPINVEKCSSIHNPILNVKIQQGQYVLSTPAAIYSYGTFYAPFKKMFKHIKKDLPLVKDFLLLGTGLGSALKILQQDYNLYPNATLVDIDEEVLKLSANYMNINNHKNVHWICSDAVLYIQETQNMYDLIAVDVFRDLMIPNQVKHHHFFTACKLRLNKNGIVCINYISSSSQETSETSQMLKRLFEKVEVIKSAQNIFFICKIQS